MRRLPFLLLALTCFVSGSSWLLPDPELNAQGSLLVLAVGASVAMVCVAAAIAVKRKEVGVGASKLARGRLMISTVGALGLPAVMLIAGRGYLSSVMAVAAQAGIPVAVVIAAGALGDNENSQTMLLPALSALSGALLLLPIGLPASSAGWTGLLLYVGAAIVAALSTVICHDELKQAGAGGLAFASGANALFLWLAFAVSFSLPGESVGCVTCLLTSSVLADAAAASVISLGLLVLLYLVPPLTFAARFIFTPLVGAVEAYVLMRPTVSLRTAVGAGLMAVGAVVMCMPIAGRNRSDGPLSFQ